MVGGSGKRGAEDHECIVAERGGARDGSHATKRAFLMDECGFEGVPKARHPELELLVGAGLG